MRMLRVRMGQVLLVDWIIRKLVAAAVDAIASVAADDVVDLMPVIGHFVAPRFRIHAVVVKEGLRFSFLAAQAHLGLEICISTTGQHSVSTLSFLPSTSTSANLVMCKMLL